MEVLAVLAGFGILFGLILFPLLIVTYVFMSIALMKMAERKGIDNAWLAWIPIANLYILGLLIGRLNLSFQEFDNPELILPGLSLASMVLGGIPLIGWLVGVASFLVTIIAYYTLVEKYSPGNGILYTLLMIILPPVGAYLIFSIRENAPAS